MTNFVMSDQPNIVVISKLIRDDGDRGDVSVFWVQGHLMSILLRK